MQSPPCVLDCTGNPGPFFSQSGLKNRLVLLNSIAILFFQAVLSIGGVWKWNAENVYKERKIVYVFLICLHIFCKIVSRSLSLVGWLMVAGISVFYLVHCFLYLIFRTLLVYRLIQIFLGSHSRARASPRLMIPFYLENSPW